MIKKSIIFIIILCLFTSILLLTGCSNKNNPIPIDYRLSTSELSDYENRYVTFSGFLSLWTTSNFKTGYVLDVPVQEGPPANEEGFIAGGMAIETNKELTYTDSPIVVTGKLVFGEFVDENNLKYGCKIIDASVEVVEKENLPEYLKDSERILYNNYMSVITNALHTLNYYIYGNDNEVPEDELKIKLDFYDYEIMKKSLSENTNEIESSLLDILEKTNNLFNTINTMIDSDKTNEFSSLKEDLIQITNEFDTIIYSICIQPN